MQRLAEFILRGPMPAAVVAVGGMVLPFLFWLGAAAVGLVTLRLGPQKGLVTGLWALLPGAAWLWVGMDPAPLVVLLITMVICSVLQMTVSWEKALLAGAALAIGIAQALPLVAPAFFDQLITTAQQVYGDMNAGMMENLPEDVDPENVIRTMMIAVLGVLNYALAIAASLLARGWQARLFNPGGLQAEFHEFRLSAPTALGLLVLMAVGEFVGINGTLLLLVLGVPLLLAGLALVHGTLAKRGLGTGWLVGFYIALVVLVPWLFLVLVFAAVIDSWLDIRQRL
ncbi:MULTISPECIES: hypothetical protein [Gammaproteobacteria]|uniref:DUF2232 domain-containing protein n=1 Tax=Vreelandella halophila TaxID=86177 RepID=A0A9X5B4K2_9GAMM|nr:MULTISPECIES: hypothetical protein [Gammaproteobacteria]KAA8980733.1 hypothetical protein F3089_11010 [Halospina sp. K52047b]MYL26606.1 hypothetical protein [Halomonas utahensis]MYL73943.1 hypothetical protein [Halomonas sp. 22501_18_FS]